MTIRITDIDGKRPTFTQWDVDRVLYIDGCESQPMLHFANPMLTRAIVVEPEADGSRWVCRVPNFLLQFAMPIVVSVFLQPDEGKTVLMQRIDVRPKPKPQDYTYEENIGYVNWVQMTESIQEMLDNGEFDGKDGNSIWTYDPLYNPDIGSGTDKWFYIEHLIGRDDMEPQIGDVIFWTDSFSHVTYAYAVASVSQTKCRSKLICRVTGQGSADLSAYRTAAAQDVIDAAQDTAINGKLSTTGNAYRAASIPMGQLDSTSTATVMTATVPGITELRDGVCVWLKNGVITSAAGVTLNINELGAKPIYNSIAEATATTTTFSKSYTMLFIYNSTRVTGGCWDMVYGYDSNTTYTPVKMGFGYTTCSTAEATAAKTAALSSYTLTTGGIVAVKFANAVPAGATLNINSKGAKAIYYKDAAITAGVIKAGDTVTMIYSTYYHVLSIDRDVDTLPPSPSDDNPLMDSAASPGSSADYARADHVHPSDSSKIGYDDEPNIVTMTASGSTVTCFKTFFEIYGVFYSQRNAYFILAASQTDYQLFNLDRVDGGNQTIYLSSIVGGVLSQIVLTPGGSSTMTGTLTTIDLNLQSAQGVSF